MNSTLVSRNDLSRYVSLTQDHSRTGDPPKRQESHSLHSELCERVILSIVLFLIVFAPLAYGAVEPWARNVVLLSIGSMACFWLWRFVSLGRPKLSFPPFFPAAILFLVLIALQLVPLPGALKDFLTPDRPTSRHRIGRLEVGAVDSEPRQDRCWSAVPCSLSGFLLRIAQFLSTQEMGQAHADCLADSGKFRGSLWVGRILDRTPAYFLVSEDLLS